MNRELIVMTFRCQDEAETVLKAVRAMRKSPALSLERVVLVTKNRKGEVTIRPSREPASAREDKDTRLLLSLAELMFDIPSEVTISALTQRGMDGRFVKEIAKIMEEESSALFFLISDTSVYDPDEMRRTLALFKGIIHQTSLLPEVENYLSRET